MTEFPFDLSVLPKHEGAYMVGGSVRDLLMKRPPADYDIVVSGDADAYARSLGVAMGGHPAKIGKPGLDVIRVVSDLGVFDISPMQGSTIEEDLERRDFTINAMAYDVSSRNLIDIFQGKRDLADKRIRMVSRRAFEKDPVRMVRAFRIGADLGFDIEPETEVMIAREVASIGKTAGERIREELLKLLESAHSHTYLSRMADTGLLFQIFPEMKVLKGFKQNNHHSLDVFAHTMKAYAYLEGLINSPDQLVPEAGASIGEVIRGRRFALLKCAMLLHDIGKPSTHTFDAAGAIHFFGHNNRGAEIAESIGLRLRFSNKERSYVDRVIRGHSQPLLLYLAEQSGTLTPKGVTRFFMKSGEYTPDILCHSIADGKGKGKVVQDAPFGRFITTLLDKYYRDYVPQAPGPALLTGVDLIEVFGLSPSPLFGVILAAIEEGRLSGEIRSKEDAFALTASIIDRGNNKPVS